MNTVKISAFFLALIAFNTCLIIHTSASEENKTLTLDIDDINKISIDAGAGFLKITGNPELEQIIVNAQISDNEKPYKLELTKKGRTAKLIAKSTNNSSNFSFFKFSNHDTMINLTVEIPSNLIADIDDGSGSITINSLDNKLNIDDGSGEINLHRITGPVTISDGSGSIDVKQVSKNITIEDGSGSIVIRQVQGDVDIDDGSGNIDIAKIGGSVEVDDGSGNISIDSVEKNVNILEDGSGNVQLSKISGEVYRND